MFHSHNCIIYTVFHVIPTSIIYLSLPGPPPTPPCNTVFQVLRTCIIYSSFPGFTTCCTHACIIYTVFQVLPTSFPCFTNLYYSFLVLLPPVYILFQVLPTHIIHLSFTVFSPHLYYSFPGFTLAL